MLGEQSGSAGGSHEGVGIMLYTPDGNLRPLEEIEADVIRLAIGHYRGRMTEVARRLGIGRSTLYRKLSDLGIDNAA
jgi:DNA-binding NtrC family response regulator